jgi:LysM repeat protein
MQNKSQGRLLGILVVGMLLASACTQTYSQAPLATPTLISTGLFVSPFPSGQDPLQIVADLGTQTAMAKTAAVGGTAAPGTSVAATATNLTGAAATPAAATVVPVTHPAEPASTSVISTGAVGAPSNYTLQAGEFPYCIARRFNINPDQLLSANGISDGSLFKPGLTLTIPKAGPFPGDRTLHPHPDTYTVDSADTTIAGVACYYGDVLPQEIASANGLSVSSALTIGQHLSIP